MTRLDRAILLSAWAVILGCGVAGVWANSKRPRILPQLVKLEEWVEQERLGIKEPPPPYVPVGPPGFDGRLGMICPRSGPYLARVVAVAPPERLEREDVEILCRPVIYSEAADLDGARIAWQHGCDRATLLPHERRMEGPVTRIVVERAERTGEFRPVAELGPQAESYADPSAAPGQEYRYRVRFEGMETRIRGGKYVREDASKAAESGTLRLPPAHRVRLVGGDARLAVVRVETYDRRRKAWSSKDLTVRPGEAIGPTGWRLEALRFEKSTLTAEATDERHERRRLTTKD